jgi:hypothetical protein
MDQNEGRHVRPLSVASKRGDAEEASRSQRTQIARDARGGTSPTGHRTRSDRVSEKNGE